MTRDCDACGATYEAKLRTSKFCPGAGCKRARERDRKRRRDGGGVVIELPVVSDELGVVGRATQAALAAVDRLDTPAGWNVMVIARRLDASSGDTGSSVAQLSKQHLAALAEATKDARVEADEVDELKARRQRRSG